MTALAEAVRVLGLEKRSHKPATDIEYLDMVDHGLPVRSLDKISTAVAPNDNSFKYRIVSKASLARCKPSNRLSPNHSVVVARLASIWASALRIWKSEGAARAFLDRAHPLLDGRRPLDLVLENEIGAELVRSILGRLEYGSAV
jgi:putative toxin-antitoxin system antitoxin component (TIGR02293 family)